MIFMSTPAMRVITAWLTFSQVIALRKPEQRPGFARDNIKNDQISDGGNYV
jgi:hypothetical protein